MRPPCNVRPMSQGTSAPVEVAPGWYTLPEQVAYASHKTGSSPCEPGSFCALGVKWPCPPGTFGNSSLLQSPACSGMCDAGYGTYREALVRVQRTPDVIEKALNTVHVIHTGTTATAALSWARSTPAAMPACTARWAVGSPLLLFPGSTRQDRLPTPATAPSPAQAGPSASTVCGHCAQQAGSAVRTG